MQSKTETGEFFLGFTYSDLLDSINVDRRLESCEKYIWSTKILLEIENGADCTDWYRNGYEKMVSSHLEQDLDKDTLKECAYAAVDGNQLSILKLLMKKYKTKKIYAKALTRASQPDRYALFVILNKNVVFPSTVTNTVLYSIFMEVSGKSNSPVKNSSLDNTIPLLAYSNLTQTYVDVMSCESE